MARFLKIGESVPDDAESEHDSKGSRAAQTGVKVVRYRHRYIGHLPKVTSPPNHD